MAARTWDDGTGRVPAGGHPEVTFEPDQQVSRLWGIPIVGMTVRLLALIPNFLVLYVLFFGMSATFLVSWIPVLFLGQQPFAPFYALTYRYLVRTVAWLLFLASPLPPFLGSGPHPVNLELPAGGSINRLWGIPIVGLYLRALLVFPHAIVLLALGIVLYLSVFILWIPILATGRVPGPLRSLYEGYLRVTARAGLWVTLTPVPYPPII